VKRSSTVKFLKDWWHSLLLFILVIISFLAWMTYGLLGGHLFMVTTPSMGETAPRGALVIVPPNSANQQLKVGEIAVFKVPGSNEMFIHYLYQKLPDGRYETKGALEAKPDPWTIGRPDIIGINPTIIPAIGWLYKTYAWFAIGSIILIIISIVVPKLHHRHLLYLIVPIVLLTIPALVYKPFIDGYVLNSNYVGHNAYVEITNDGLFEANYSLPTGKTVLIDPGHAKTLVYHNFPQSQLSKMYDIKISVVLYWWFILLASAVCALPIALYWIFHFKWIKHHRHLQMTTSVLNEG
jgi:signal peptidase I